MDMTFVELFAKACGHHPYPFQTRFAESEFLPHLMCVPSGFGKTATVILGWLYRRRVATQEVRQSTPRRLVYCLPTQAIIEQPFDYCQRWLERIGIRDVGLHLIRPGDEPGLWEAHPERDAIIIGTHDMLLSRALNRGHTVSCYQWPVHFSLLNNDALWVIDETHLMGPGLATSAQLAGLRSKLGTVGRCHTVWMSAILDENAARTVDNFMDVAASQVHVLDAADCATESVQKLLNAAKPLAQSPLSLSRESAGTYTRDLACQIVRAHLPGTITLAVVNRVERAQKLYEAVNAEQRKKRSEAQLFLFHSRFRPRDWRYTQSRALDETSLPIAGRILIATQAIEAAVDISATTLFTELAPWPSLVQRFGRCNRRGLCDQGENFPAQIYWIDVSTEENKAEDVARPYERGPLVAARVRLLKTSDVGPGSLVCIDHREESTVYPVLRRKDLLELFDTTSELSGNNLDISRYIHEPDDAEAYVYWRSWDLKRQRNAPPVPKDEDGTIVFPAAFRDELCPVSVASLRGENGFVKKAKNLVWTWSPLDGRWVNVGPADVRPGIVLLIHTSAGGYGSEFGWTGECESVLQAGEVAIDVEMTPRANEQLSDDDLGSDPVTLRHHLKDVAEQATRLSRIPSLEAERIPWSAIIRAAWWHDIGKAHPTFQRAIHRDRRASESLDPMQTWATSGTSRQLVYSTPEDRERAGFRHELVSVLAWLNRHDRSPEADLIAYLIAVHHGKVRSSLRRMPNESSDTRDSNRMSTRGVCQGDSIPEVLIGNGDVSPAFQVSLDLMELGDKNGKSGWVSRCLKLLLAEDVGPFRLALYETFLRVADWRGNGIGGCP